MKRNIKYLTFINLIFLVMMMAAGAAEGSLSDLIYCLGFALPIGLGFLLCGIECKPRELFKMKKSGALMLASLGAPAVVVIMGISYLTAIIIKALSGEVSAIDVSIPFWQALIFSAILPAILEEMLFRYLPMKLLSPHSKRIAVILSAVFFAAAHRSAQSLLYALFAGVVFMALDLASESILPSLLLHFINNLTSLLIAYYGEHNAAKIGLFVIFSLLLALSLAIFAVNSKKIILEIKDAFSGGESYGANPVPLFFLVPCLVLCVLEFAL